MQNPCRRRDLDGRALHLGALALAIAACATLPEHDPVLEDARAAVVAVHNDPQVVALAPLELGRAVETARHADVVRTEHGDIAALHHLAYLASTRAAVAAETARLKSAEASVAAANAERDRVRLEARAREAERAQRDAAQAQREAEHARGQAEATRREALAAQERAAGAEWETEAAGRQMNRRVEIVISDEQGTIGPRGSAPPRTSAGAPPG